VAKHSADDGLADALHEMLHGSFSKGDFAATLFEHLCSNAELKCPTYISNALTWLQQELGAE
jgi:hypothetical protein